MAVPHISSRRPGRSGDIYANALQNSQTGFVLADLATGRVLEANRAFLRMSARTSGEVAGCNFWEPPLVADAAAGSEVHTHLRSGGAVEAVELPLETGDGCWRLMEVSAAPSSGAVLLETRDVTGREEARVAERFETLRSLAGRSAVEFDALGSALRQTPELHELRAAAERAACIAAHLRAFAGSLTLDLRPLSLNHFVEGTLPPLRELFGAKIEVAVELASDLAPAMVDPDQLRQVILTLAQNSFEALGSHGAFSLQTAMVHQMEPGLGMAGAGGGPFAMLAISDNGPGFDDQSWAHLYEPFFTTKTGGRNLGLGLAAVYGIVRQMGGRLWAFSQPGKGAAFRIYFPALPPTATILLVEANDVLRTVMANVLRKRGHHILTAMHSEEALRISEAQGAPDVLISRPDLQLAGRLAQLKPHLRVLYLETYGNTPDALASLLPLRSATLHKPFNPDMLLTKVRELLAD